MKWPENGGRQHKLVELLREEGGDGLLKTTQKIYIYKIKITQQIPEVTCACRVIGGRPRVVTGFLSPPPPRPVTDVDPPTLVALERART